MPYVFLCLRHLVLRLLQAALMLGLGLAVMPHVFAEPQLKQDAGHCVFYADVPYRVGYSHFMLQNPPRYVVDLMSLARGMRLDDYRLASCDVSAVRTAHHEGFKTRLVFDLKQAVKPRITLKRMSMFPVAYRLSIAFAPFKAQPSPKSMQVEPPKAVMQPALEAKRMQQTRRDVVIVIDPGHGGKDPGATSAGGVHEKNVVLAISRYLQRDLNRRQGYKAYLTRNSDRYLKLRERLAVARRYKPDLFIAIHADAFKNTKAHGASVFALSQRGATSEAARWLAKKENDSELVGGVDLEDKSADLKSVLLDLSQSATIGASVEAGNALLKQLKRHTKLHHRVVEQAAFVVLKSPDIPSLLVETGFLSNRREAAHLRKASYQKKIALALSAGLDAYFQAHPPRGTWLAWRRARTNLTYRVQPGDSLSRIAARYGLRTRDLQKWNRLASSTLQVHQLLSIPKVGQA